MGSDDETLAAIRADLDSTYVQYHPRAVAHIRFLLQRLDAALAREEPRLRAMELAKTLLVTTQTDLDYAESEVRRLTETVEAVRARAAASNARVERLEHVLRAAETPLLAACLLYEGGSIQRERTQAAAEAVEAALQGDTK